MLTIEHANGLPSDRVETMDEAETLLKGVYGLDVVICDNWDQVGENRSRALAWESAEESDNDDGSNAVAQIIRDERA